MFSKWSEVSFQFINSFKTQGSEQNSFCFVTCKKKNKAWPPTWVNAHFQTLKTVCGLQLSATSLLSPRFEDPAGKKGKNLPASGCLQHISHAVLIFSLSLNLCSWMITPWQLWASSLTSTPPSQQLIRNTVWTQSLNQPKKLWQNLVYKVCLRQRCT